MRLPSAISATLFYRCYIYMYIQRRVPLYLYIDNEEGLLGRSRSPSIQEIVQ